MTTHIKYPSIDQFRGVVKSVKEMSNNHRVLVPTLRFRGTVKLHGTNAGVACNGNDIWYQSRERVITPLSDNAGFAQFAQAHQDFFIRLHAAIRTVTKRKVGEVITIFGEWCGKGINKSVAICELPKMFVVFGVSIGTHDAESDNREWLSQDDIDAAFVPMMLEANVEKVYHINQFQTWEVDIDFNNPEQLQNKLVELTIAVEDECPVGKKFGISGIGEGIVWKCIDEQDLPFPVNQLRFKVKGEKHSVSKVRVLAEVDVEKVANIQEFVERVVTENRLQQMRDKMVEMEIDPSDVKNTGTFLKYLGIDVIKEESDTLEASGITNKEVMGKISQVGRNWYLSKLDQEVVQ